MPKIIHPEETPTVDPVEEDSVTELEEEQVEPLSIEDADPEYPVWEGGPTAGEVVEWKNKFKNVYVTSLTADFHVAWRTINRMEFKQIVKRVETLMANGSVSEADAEMLNEELICQIAILFPSISDFNSELAGLPAIVSQQVLAASGFNSLDTVQL